MIMLLCVAYLTLFGVGAQPTRSLLASPLLYRL